MCVPLIAVGVTLATTAASMAAASAQQSTATKNANRAASQANDAALKQTSADYAQQEATMRYQDETWQQDIDFATQTLDYQQSEFAKQKDYATDTGKAILQNEGSQLAQAAQVLNLQKKQQDVIRALRPDFNAAPLDGKAPARNVRNNTPIPTLFVGQLGATSDGKFAKVATPEAGIDMNLAQYERYQKAGKLSLKDMILTGTPRSDNPNVDSYIAAVAKDMKIRPDQPVDLRDPATAASFIMAAARQEGGSFDAETVVRGVLQHLKGQPGELGGDPGKVQPPAPKPSAAAAPAPAPVKPPMPAEVKAKAEQDAITYAPRANAEWSAKPLFPDTAQFNAALTQEIKGGGSQLLRQWFQVLNLRTPEDQRRFVAEQRRILAGAR